MRLKKASARSRAPTGTGVKPATLHDRILAETEERITSGQWPPGHPVPSEVDLARHYGCARMTVNKVMAQLAKAGLIERRRKSGSFVAYPSPRAAMLEIHGIETEVKALGLDYRYTMLSRAVRCASKADHTRLETQGSADLVELTCLHHAGNRPFCFENRLISLETVPDARHADYSHTPPGAWLLQAVPWSAAEHRIHAVSASAALARWLDVPVGAACLVVDRRTWNAQGAITHVRLTYPGEQHSLVARFTPTTQ